MKEIFDKDGNKLYLADLIRDYILMLEKKYKNPEAVFALTYDDKSGWEDNEYIQGIHIVPNGYDGNDYYSIGEEDRLPGGNNVPKIDVDLLWEGDRKWGNDYVFTVDGVPAETVDDVYHKTAVAEILEEMKENGHELASNERYTRIYNLPNRIKYYKYYSVFAKKENKK